MHVFVLFVWVLIGINERNFSSLHTFVFFGQMKPESTFDVHDLSRSSHFVVSMWTSHKYNRQSLKLWSLQPSFEINVL